MVSQFHRVDASPARAYLPRGAQIGILAMLSWGLVVAGWKAMSLAFLLLLGA